MLHEMGFETGIDSTRCSSARARSAGGRAPARARTWLHSGSRYWRQGPSCRTHRLGSNEQSKCTGTAEPLPLVRNLDSVGRTTRSSGLGGIVGRRRRGDTRVGRSSRWRRSPARCDLHPRPCCSFGAIVGAEAAGVGTAGRRGRALGSTSVFIEQRHGSRSPTRARDGRFVVFLDQPMPSSDGSPRLITGSRRKEDGRCAIPRAGGQTTGRGSARATLLAEVACRPRREGGDVFLDGARGGAWAPTRGSRPRPGAARTRAKVPGVPTARGAEAWMYVDAAAGRSDEHRPTWRARFADLTGPWSCITAYADTAGKEEDVRRRGGRRGRPRFSTRSRHDLRSPLTR